MPLRTQSLPNLYGGVSQQAAMTRSVNQAEEAVNCSFSVAEGVSKRPPLEVVNTLTSFPVADSFIGWINHSSGEWIVVVIPGDGSYRAYRVNTGGQLTTINGDTGLDYLTCEGPARKSFRMTQAGDRVFIANLEVTMTMTSDTVPGSLAGSAPNLQSNELDNATSGQIWKIHGTEEQPFDDYYAKYDGSVWVEWVEPGLNFRIDGTTMPHELEVIDTVDVNPERFEVEFKQVSWGEREVGDNDSNAAPSFLGRTLTGMDFIGDRLVLMSDRHLIMSEVGEYTNFWRTTVLDVLDSDRIDVSIKHREADAARWIESASGEYVVFAGDRQFVMNSSPALTPSTVGLKPVTRYPSSAHVRPQAAGPNIYFPSEAGDSTHLREMFIQEDTITLDAANASSHAFKYVPASVSSFVVHPDYQTALIATEDQPNNLFCYQYMWLGNQKVMSAWGRWELAEDPTVVSLQVIDKYVYCVFEHRAGDLMLGRFNLNAGDGHGTFGHKVHLDLLEQPAVQYNAAENRTYFTVRSEVVTAALHEPAPSTGVPQVSLWLTEPVIGQSVNTDQTYLQLDLDPSGGGIPSGFSGATTFNVVNVETGAKYGTTAFAFDNSPASPNITVRIGTEDPNAPDWLSNASIGRYIEFVGFPDPNAATGDPDVIEAQNLRYSGVSRLVKGTGWPDEGTTLRLPEEPSFTVVSGSNGLQFYLEGNWTGGEWWYGIEYEQRFRFSEQFARGEGGEPIVNARVQLRDLIAHFTETPVFRLRTLHRGRPVEDMTVVPKALDVRTARTLGDDWFRLNRPVQYNGTYRLPVLAGADDAVIEILNDAYTPCNLQAAEWKALISTKFGR